MKAGDIVRHRSGWKGQIVAVRDRDGLIEVRPRNRAGDRPNDGTLGDRVGAKWYHAADFDVAGAATPDPDIPRPKRPGFGAGPQETMRPSNQLDVRDRYLRDPLFHHLVQTMLAAIQGGHYTPTEIREAAMLAQVIYEELNPRPVFVGMYPDPRD